VRELRLLSLLPSATEILHALGLGAYQVGRSHECDYPEEAKALPACSRPAIPVNGSSAELDRLVKERLRSALSIYELDSDLIRRLNPTHIFTQTQCEVCAVSLKDVERSLCEDLGGEVCVLSLEPYCLTDVWRDIRRVAQACDVTSGGDQLIETLQIQMQAAEDLAAVASRRPTVAAIEWLEPLMAGGNWIPELIAMAGGRNLFGEAGHHSPWMTWQDVVAADPDMLVAFPCGFDLPRTRSEMHWLTTRSGWNALRAVHQNNVYLCDGNRFMNRPGPGLVASLRIFAEILHPDLFDAEMEGIGWEKFVG
jgi:iron complex transport system substrate-binding protein